MWRTASVTSGQRGGLFGRNGMTMREKLGAVRALDTLPPIKMATPSFLASMMCMPGDMV